MLDHGPVTVGAPGTLTSMVSPLCRGTLANMVVTSSYLAVSWLALPIFTRIGVVMVSWTQSPEVADSTFTAVTWARNDGGRVAAT